ncbi:pilus assembly protein TadG-related protein [Streptomyces sp. NPDC006997]|uniref:pilus assembly protein TadG-related protein n=1 Tax=Streptomyces sp. NPDC006997 TaxID=3155356 RepID=UPI0033DCE5E8
MTRSRRHGDAGQAFPIYITVVGGLLFLAFAYFAVGQAAATRNEAQTAADAAALAAAQDRRDLLAGRWLTDVLDPGRWQDIFDGNVQDLEPSCWRAEELATQNGAHLTGAGCYSPEPLRFTVEVETDDPVGDSIVPGTESRHATATATAVIEPRCGFKPLPEDAEDDVLPSLTCKGGAIWDLDPDNLLDLPEPKDLFDVHLAD